MVVAAVPAPAAAPVAPKPPPPPRTMPNRICRIAVQIMCYLLALLQIDLWIVDNDFINTLEKLNVNAAGKGAVGVVGAAAHAYAMLSFIHLYIFLEIIFCTYTLIIIHFDKPLMFIIGVGLRGFNLVVCLLTYSLVISYGMDTFIKFSSKESVSREYLKMVTGFCFALLFHTGVLLALVYLFILQRKANPKTPATAPAAVAVAPMPVAPM